MKVNLSFEAKELLDRMKYLKKEVKDNFQTAIESLSLMTYNKAIQLASQKLNTTREDYINHLKYEKLDNNIYIIYLSDAMNHIEEGWRPYNMWPKIATSEKGGIHHINKKGQKYVHIPFDPKMSRHKPARYDVVNINQAIKAIEKDINVQKIVKKINQPNFQGKVTTYKGITNEKLKGLTKITKKYEKRSQSTFLLFRTMSEGKIPEGDQWKNKGYAGVNIFPDLEKFVEKELDNIIKRLL